jgi:hypothetical protein
MDFDPTLLDHFVSLDVAMLLAEAGYNNEGHLYTQVFDWLHGRGLHIHDCWISPIRQWSVCVVEVSAGKRLWPEIIINLRGEEMPKEQYYPDRRTAWNIALIEASKILQLKNLPNA